MPPRSAEPTPSEIARLGHVAALLRRELSKRDWSVRYFNRELGLEPTSTRVYTWLRCRAAIQPDDRAKVAKVLGVAERELEPRELVREQLPAPSRGWTDAKGNPVEVQIAARPIGRTMIGGGEVLAFNINADGSARLRLDVTLPLNTAAPLLRLLLDAGLVVGEGDDR